LPPLFVMMLTLPDIVPPIVANQRTGHAKHGVAGEVLVVVDEYLCDQRLEAGLEDQRVQMGGPIGMPFLRIKKPADDSDRVGDSGRAMQLVDDHFPTQNDENVIVQARPGGHATDPAVRTAVAQTMAAVAKSPKVYDVESPYRHADHVSKDGRSVLVTFKVHGDASQAENAIQPIVDSVHRVKVANPRVYVGEFGSASASKALSQAFADDFGKAEKLSLPITLVILLLAFGALVAAGIPLLLGLTAVIATLGLFFTGDRQGKLMFVQQPMKMASAESLCDTKTDPDFSILTIGTHNNCGSVTEVIKVHYVLPFLAEGRFSGVTLQGVNDLQHQYQQRFGPDDYRPNLFVTYWSFRAMIGFLGFPVLFALTVLWLTRGGRIPGRRWFSWFALLTIPTPFLANSAGWVFTEMGRQPWIVVPNPTGDQLVRFTVREGVSNHASGMVITSLVTFTLLYAVLAVIWFWLLKRYVVAGPLEHDAEPAPPAAPDDAEVAPLSFAY